jgi:hypothetical protein
MKPTSKSSNSAWPTNGPSPNSNLYKGERSQRANAVSMASASGLNLWERAEAKIRPGRGQIVLTMTAHQIHPNRQPRPRHD